MISEKFNLKINDLYKVYSKLIDDLSFEELDGFLSSNPELNKRITAGGFRVIKHNSEALKKKVVRFVNSENLRDLFFIWYEKQEDSRTFLDQYFISEEYKSIQSEMKIIDSTYILPDTKFFEFLCVLKPSESANFLLFSPIYFETMQAKILENIWLNHIDICADSEKIITDLSMKLEASHKEILEKELEIKRALKEKSTIEKKLTEATLKIQKSNSSRVNDFVEKERSEHLNEVSKLNSDISYLNEELKTKEENNLLLKKDYEKLLNKIQNIENQNSNLQKKLENLKLEKEKPFTSILDKINLFELIVALNEPDEIKEFLEKNLIKSYQDKPVSEKIFKEFWANCVAIEKDNLNKIKNFLISDINSDSFIEIWDPDLFSDVKFSLRARAVMINILGELLRQNVAEPKDRF